MTAEWWHVEFAPSDDPRAAGPGTLIIPDALAGLAPRLSQITNCVSEAADAIRTLAVLMAEAFKPTCPCPGVTHTMRCGLGGQVHIVLPEATP